ncbi:MAG: hypothetical protein CMP54_02810 [Flavobacteriales bacterium]|nr:hypothetical protein [Flavobacteriales bacterium]|tara:strand:+ start:507 stop:1016 length:510 start_codon:yes stop_codon:yes gene_type:complete
MEIFIDNIVYIVVFVTIVTLVFFFLNRSQRSVISNDNSSYNQIEIRLRAYERLILFLERIEPVSMINRLELHNQSIDFIISSLIKNIVVEYEYNMSQQIYVSDNLWKSIELIKNKIINNISNTSKLLSNDSSVDDLVRELLEDSKKHIIIINEIKKTLKEEVKLISKTC